MRSLQIKPQRKVGKDDSDVATCQGRGRGLVSKRGGDD